MNKKNTVLKLTLAASILAGCTHPPRPAESQHANSPNAYPHTMPRANYGEWFIEPRTCTIRANAAEFTVSTDGIPERSTLNLRALFMAPQARPPVAEISEILAPLPIEGARRGYNIVLAYDAENAAHMFKPDTYLIVRYQPVLSSIVLESSFSTRGLMQALADLSKYC